MNSTTAPDTEATARNARVATWLTQLEDRPGYYRYCVHACKPYAGEATAQAVGLLWELDRLHELSEADRRARVVALQSYQGEDGVFRDPLITEDDRIDKTHPWLKIHEHLSGACEQALAILGAEPAQPNRTPPIYDIRELEPEWIRGLDHREVPWGRCHNVAFSLVWYRKQLGLIETLDAKAKRIYELIESEMINPADRMPGATDHSIGRRIAGYYMLTFCYLPFGMRLPNPDAAIDLIIDAVTPDGEIGEGGMCQNWDAMHVLNHVCRETGWGYRYDEAVTVARRLAGFLERVHRKPDGGYSFHRDTCQQEHNLTRVAPPRAEGDMQGTLMAVACLNIADALARKAYCRTYLDAAVGARPPEPDA